VTVKKTIQTRPGKRKKHIHAFIESRLTKLVFMRTRSGSLAAVMARVPSHPAHSGVLCICADKREHSFPAAPNGGYPRGSPRPEGQQALKPRSPPALQIQRSVWRSLFSATSASFNTGVWRWSAGSSPTVNGSDTNTACWHCLLLLLNGTGTRKHSCWRGRVAQITTALSARDHSTALVGAFALKRQHDRIQ